ncbi:MAG: tRNA U-34 5-methylaminomethyl-2-thiouridine biosynthesis protein [Planctomycetota bacterium]|nr:tRNA U-34 5-methylaminomethyl-2-thiouridine biosynthesis protein [Planctomycetota bacterium]MDA1114647.1 tRNA U-34 5-methylaminomethyl-2-thiouridine biosynthesis protein [Planctomycetota bacterium]
MSEPGRIVTGCLAPHPPHLVYAANPEQNEPRSSGAGAWAPLLEGYARLRESIKDKEYDVILVHTPHWKTCVGHHLLGVPHFEGLSVDPIFPNLFRFHFDLQVDVELAQAIHDEAEKEGLVMNMMRNPEFRVDYGTITSNYLVRPAFDLPIVAISSARTYFDYSDEAGEREMLALGAATKRAVEKTGRKALLLASCSLSHRHFTDEPADPEDPSFEHIYNENQSKWDHHVMNLMQTGQTRRLLEEMPDFIAQANAECRDGSLTWLLGAMDVPNMEAKIHGYGTVIGTGNAIVEWDLAAAEVQA